MKTQEEWHPEPRNTPATRNQERFETIKRPVFFLYVFLLVPCMFPSTYSYLFPLIPFFMNESYFFMNQIRISEYLNVAFISVLKFAVKIPAYISPMLCFYPVGRFSLLTFHRRRCCPHLRRQTQK